MQAYDLIVIGSGPAGRRAACAGGQAQEVRACRREGAAGGRGVRAHRDYSIQDTARETVLNPSGWRERGFYGRGHRSKQTITADDLSRRLAITLDHEVEILEHQFARNSVDWVRARHLFIDPLHIEVATDTGHQRFTAQRFIIAVGTEALPAPAHPVRW